MRKPPPAFNRCLFVTTLLASFLPVMGSAWCVCEPLFTAPAMIIADGHSPVLGDFNGDDIMDLAFVSSTAISVMLGSVGTVFGPPTEYLQNEAGKHPAVADLNVDGFDDLIAAGPGRLFVLLGDTAGTLARQPDVPVPGSDALWHDDHVAIADFNEDGFGDVVSGADSLSLVFGHGDGTFSRPSVIARVGESGVVLPADLDGDGHEDFIVCHGWGGRLSLWLGDGSGTFSDVRFLGFNNSEFWGNSIWDVAADDLDADGVLDLAVATGGDNPYSHWPWGAPLILHGLGDGAFAPPIGVGILPDGTALSVESGDLNGDGWPDILFTGGGCTGVLFATSRLDGALGEFTCDEAFNLPYWIHVGDVDSDGRDDVMTVRLYYGGRPPDLEIWLNQCVATPVEVQDFVGEHDQDRVRLTWILSPQAVGSLDGIHVQRSGGANYPYVQLTTIPLPPATHMTFEDSNLLAGGEAWYRLDLLERDGQHALVGPWRVPLRADSPSTMLHSASETPERKIRIRYSVGDPGEPVTFAVFDVRGRLIWKREVADERSGAHSILWDRRNRTGVRAPSGIYLLRMWTSRVHHGTKLLLR